MKIDYEKYEVFDPDYLNANLGFVSGVLELCEQAGDNLGRDNDSKIEWVLSEANNRVREMIKQLHEATIYAAKERAEK